MVVKRKNIINASDDSNLIIQRAKTSGGDMKTISVEVEIEEQANRVPLDVDMETGEILEADYREMDNEAEDAGLEQAMMEAELAAAGAGYEF